MPKFTIESTCKWIADFLSWNLRCSCTTRICRWLWFRPTWCQTLLPEVSSFHTLLNHATAIFFLLFRMWISESWKQKNKIVYIGKISSLILPLTQKLIGPELLLAAPVRLWLRGGRPRVGGGSSLTRSRRETKTILQSRRCSLLAPWSSAGGRGGGQLQLAPTYTTVGFAHFS